MTLSHRLRAAAGGSAELVTTNLYRHYDFNDVNCYSPVFGSAINDLSGSGASQYPGNKHAAFSGGTPTVDSSTGSVTLPSGYSFTANWTRESLAVTAGTGPFTLEFWINPYLPQTYSSSVVMDCAPSHIVFSPEFIFYYRTMGVQFTNTGWSGSGLTGSANSWEWNANTGVTTPSGGGSNYTNTFESNLYSGVSGYVGWTHLVISRTSTGTGGLKFYRNNSLKYTGTNSINYNFTQASSGGLFWANIEECKWAIVREYKYGFTAADVAANYNYDKARFGL